MSGNQIVLVTGSTGFLGQHIVKLLQENDPSVKEIRCLDLKEYQNKLEHSCEKPMKIIVGDIRDPKIVGSALEGVDCIIHAAGYIDTDIWPNLDELNSINVHGTKVLLDAAVEYNVPHFIYISSVDVVVGDDPIYYGAENTTPVPKKTIFPGYCSSKFEAETLVIKYNSKELKNGSGTLNTVILRPTVLYGEEDDIFVTETLRVAKESKGTLMKIDNIFTRFQPTYVGNAAWACIKAKDKLQTDQSIGSEDFFITDDTPILDPFDFMKPFLESRGLKLSNRSFPYWLLILILNTIVTFVSILRPFYPIKLSKKINPAKVKYISNTYYFNRNKAILRLNYEPLYDPEESHARALKYYQHVSI